MRGPKVFKGYWRDPEATAAAFAGGWFHRVTSVSVTTTTTCSSSTGSRT